MVSFACSPTRRAAARPVQEASVPVAEQVYRRLRDDIAAGRLAPRARSQPVALPDRRAFGKEGLFEIVIRPWNAPGGKAFS